MPKASKGSALITALFIMALIAIAATAMSSRLQFDIHRTRLSLASDALYLASEAVTFWAMDRLSDPKQPFNTSNKNGKLMDYPSALAHIYPNVVINGELYDLQAQFNLNNLQDKQYQLVFYNLLDYTLNNTNALSRKFIVNATTQWINPYQPDRGHDALFETYKNSKPPYFSGYQPMKHVSEFRMVANVNAIMYQTLLPLITALPDITPININTAPKTLLRSLGLGLKDTEVNELLNARKAHGIQNLEKIAQLLNKANIPRNEITTESEYFLCIATAENADLTLKVYTILKKEHDKKKKPRVKLISESLNSL